MPELNARFKFHLAENEIEKLDKDSENAGMSRSAYLRSLIQNRPPIPFPKPDLFHFIYEAKVIGLVVNQLAIRAHTQSFIDIEKVSTCMQRLQKLTDDFFDMYADYRAEVKKHPIKYTLIPKGTEREIGFRLTEEDKKMLLEFAEQTKLSRKNYLKTLIKGGRPTETPPHQYWKFAHEVRCILANMCSIYMSAISLHDPSQDVLCEYFLSLQKTVAGLAHWF